MDFTSQWLNDLLGSMEDNLDNKALGRILADCSNNCTSYWAVKAKEIRNKYPSDTDKTILLDEFRKVLPAGDLEVIVEGSKILWSFSGGECPCPIGNITKNPNVCLCSVGHVRGMLEPLLGKKLNVEIEQTRLRGGSKCAFVVSVLE
jgi:predicted ArsR family transcriptional regulator